MAIQHDQQADLGATNGEQRADAPRSAGGPFASVPREGAAATKQSPPRKREKVSLGRVTRGDTTGHMISDVVLGDTSCAEVARLLGMSEQAVRYKKAIFLEAGIERVNGSVGEPDTGEQDVLLALGKASAQLFARENPHRTEGLSRDAFLTLALVDALDRVVADPAAG